MPMCALNFFKVIVALILNGCFENFTGNGLGYLILGSNLFVESISAKRCCLAIMHKQGRTFYHVGLHVAELIFVIWCGLSRVVVDCFHGWH